MSTLIGINGLKTAGKDTTYEIVAGLREGVKRGAFADKLKIMAMRALGYDGSPAKLIEQANLLKEEGGTVSSAFDVLGPRDTLIPNGAHISGREYLQRFGGHARDLFGEGFWVDQVLPNPSAARARALGTDVDEADIVARQLETIIDPWTLQPRGAFNILCVTDVRYPNEAERVLELGGEVWEVLRPGLESDGHGSELPLARELVTRVIDNDDGVDVLAQKVEAALLDCEEHMPGGRY